MNIVDTLVFLTLYSSLVVYSVLLYIMRARNRHLPVESRTGQRMPVTKRDLPDYMYEAIQGKLTASKQAVASPELSSCAKAGWGAPGGPLSDHHFKAEVIVGLRFLAKEVQAINPSMAWPPSQTAAQYMTHVVASGGLPMAGRPCVEALVKVYDLARYTDREFSEEEFFQYQNLLWAVAASLQGINDHLSEAKLDWVSLLTASNGPV